MKTTTKPSARPAKTTSVAKKPPIDPVSLLPVRRDEDLPDANDIMDMAAAHLVADAIDQYLHAKHRLDVLVDKFADIGELDRWWYFAEVIANLAAENVVRGIIGLHHGLAGRDMGTATTRRWPNSSVVYRGTVYAAVLRPECDDLEIGEEDTEQVMKLSVSDLLPSQKPEHDLADMVNLDEFFNRQVAQREPAPVHIAAISIEKRLFRLRFWTDEEWRRIPVGEHESMNITELSGFGKVSVEPISMDDWANTLEEGHGRPPIFPEVRIFDDLRTRHGHEATRKLLETILEYGFEKSLRLLQHHAADEAADWAYFNAASDLDDARRPDNPVYFRVTTEDREQHFVARPGTSLDDVIADELRGGPRREDVCIWRNDRLLATITQGPDGQSVATRIGEPEPASQFDLGDVTGVELPSPELAILNAPPEPKPRRKAKGESKPKAKRTPRIVRS